MPNNIDLATFRDITKQELTKKANEQMQTLKKEVVDKVFNKK